MDLQNYIVQIPDSKRKEISKSNEFAIPKSTDFPVALVPGQFAECYRTYSSRELL